MEDISKHIPSAIIDLRYATASNIIGKKLYRDSRALLKSSALQALIKVAQHLTDQDLRIVIWDAYRPAKIQESLKAAVKDRNYVAHHSKHSEGVAVDITLADSNGTYLDMGTDFDDFSERAHLNYSGLLSIQVQNRQILQKAMIEAGFKANKYEWWHFEYGSNK